MVQSNVAEAKGQLSRLVNAALAGEDVIICKDGVPAVRLVPVLPLSGEDPCRVIEALTLSIDEQEALAPLSPSDWGSLHFEPQDA